MAEELFAVSGDALPDDAVLVGFRCTEALSQPFELELFVSLPDAAVLDDALGSALILTMNRPPAYPLCGIVAEVDVLQEHTGGALARLLVVPRLYLLGLSKHSRLFTEMTVPDILEKVLTDAGLSEYELRLSGDYGVEAHVCQYKESDLAFLSRWMEREGIGYFFEHGDAGDKLILCDGPLSDSLSSDPVRYHPVGDGDSSAADSLASFRCRHGSRPATVTLTDYDYANPDVDVTGSAPVYDGGAAEVTLHGERFFTPDEGERLAAIRAEELMATQAVCNGRGRVFHLRPGYCFDLQDHGVGWMNKTYLCVSLRQVGNLRAKTPDLCRLTGLDADEEFRVDVQSIDGSLQYRPQRRTSWPRIYGLEGALVDGPADSEYAQIDEDGRYRVIMQFDESGLDGGKGSTALRMMQPHTGSPEGIHFPLRKGTEVMIGFVAGDPDRPMIAGAVPNAHNPSMVGADNASRNVIHTGGNNRIEMEDQAGGQWIDVRTPVEDSYLHLGKPYNPTHHAVLKTDGDCLFHFGTNHDVLVGEQLFEHVVGPVHEVYGANMTSNITGPQQTEVTQTGVVEEYQSTQDTIVLGQVTETYNAGQDTEVHAAPRDEAFLSTQSTTVSGGGVDQQFNDIHMRLVAGSSSNTHTGDYSRHVTGATSLMYPSGVTRLYGPTTREYASLNWTVPGGIKKISVNFTFGAPNNVHNEVTLTKLTSFKLKLGMHAIGLCGYKNESTGCAIGLTKMKTEYYLASLGGTEVEIGVAPLDADQEVFKWKKRELYLVP